MNEYIEPPHIFDQFRRVFAIADLDGLSSLSFSDMEDYLNQLDDWQPGCGLEEQTVQQAIESGIVVSHGDEGMYKLGDY